MTTRTRDTIPAQVVAAHLKLRVDRQTYLTSPTLDAHLDALGELLALDPDQLVAGENPQWDAAQAARARLRELEQMLRPVFATPGLPAEWCARFAEKFAAAGSDHSLIGVLAAQPHSPPEVVATAAEIGAISSDAAVTALTRKDLDAATVASLARLAGKHIAKLCSYRDGGIKRALDHLDKVLEVTCPDTTVARIIAETAPSVVQYRLARWEHADADLLGDLVRRSSNGGLVPLTVSSHPNCPAPLLRQLRQNIPPIAHDLSVAEWEIVDRLWDTWEGTVADLVDTAIRLSGHYAAGRLTPPGTAS